MTRGDAPESSQTFEEADVPLDDIVSTASELIELYGGCVVSASQTAIELTLPNRRGVAASGGVRCRLSWTDDGEGVGSLRLTTEGPIGGPGPQQIALLVAGLAGSLAAILWPFFPKLAPVAGVGAVLAVGAYLLTLRRSGANVARDLVDRIALAQRGSKIE